MNLNDVKNTWGGIVPAHGSNNNGSKVNMALCIGLCAVIAIGGYIIYKNRQEEKNSKLKG
jgi:hypothetical protein